MRSTWGTPAAKQLACRIHLTGLGGGQDGGAEMRMGGMSMCRAAVTDGKGVSAEPRPPPPRVQRSGARRLSSLPQLPALCAPLLTPSQRWRPVSLRAASWRPPLGREPALRPPKAGLRERWPGSNGGGSSSSTNSSSSSNRRRRKSSSSSSRCASRERGSRLRRRKAWRVIQPINCRAHSFPLALQETLFDAVSVAAQHGHLAGLAAIYPCLAAGADPDARNAAGEAPLHRAARIPDAEAAAKIIRALLESGADVNAQDEDGRTPLHFAANNDNAAAAAAAISALAAAPGIQLNAADNIGATPLHWAADNSNGEAAAAAISALAAAPTFS